ncbi:DUF3265 domain-containing protein [Vibrio penaeicida]|nr:DUF3265 domain-containing protein [Vibrio penaeicida]
MLVSLQQTVQADQKRVALLVCVEFSVYGSLQKQHLYVFGYLTGRYVFGG